MTTFKKVALEIRDPEGFCPSDGYGLLLQGLEQELKAAGEQPIQPEKFLKNQQENPCIDGLVKNPAQGRVARQFLAAVAKYDEQGQGISRFDLAYAFMDLYGTQWQEKWIDTFIANTSVYAVSDRVRAIGAPLLDPSASATVKAKSLSLLQSLSVYFQGLPATDPLGKQTPLLDYYWNQKEPEVFSGYLQTPFRDFLTADEAARSVAFSRAVRAKFPDAATVEKLFQYLTRAEAIEFSKVCFKADARASLPLFEQVPLPPGASADFVERSSGEADFFPNLPQSTSFEVRQRLIDEFLGKPELELKTNFWESAKSGARTVLKKYRIVGPTEVFSIESGKPGPTTLVFSPHFHEDNPRKMFHWIKDLPLQSGRVILMPEANHAMFVAKKSTNPMNGLFNEALTNDRVDYLVVRRVEYLMGLVDGMVGLHDAGGGPFFISDLVKQGKAGPRVSPDPTPSPWVPAEVKAIQDILIYPTRTAKLPAPQLQWQIADFARTMLQRLTGEEFRFDPETITGAGAHSADSATGYMNFHLGKPAMTFEGRKSAEHGQLHAMALYSLLKAFGHRIDPSFEKVLEYPFPTTDPKLYLGLPVTRLRTRRPPAPKLDPTSPSGPTPPAPPNPTLIQFHSF